METKKPTAAVPKTTMATKAEATERLTVVNPQVETNRRDPMAVEKADKPIMVAAQTRADQVLDRAQAPVAMPKAVQVRADLEVQLQSRDLVQVGQLVQAVRRPEA